MEEMKGKVSEKGVHFNSKLFLLKLWMGSVQVKIILFCVASCFVCFIVVWGGVWLFGFVFDFFLFSTC